MTHEPQQSESNEQKKSSEASTARALNKNTSATSSREMIISCVALATSALAMVGPFWGFNSAKDISETEEKVKKDYESVMKMKESMYFLYSHQLERELLQLVKEHPGLQFTDSRGSDVKNQLQQSFDSLIDLEQSIPVEKRTKTRNLALAFVKLRNSSYKEAIDSLNADNREFPEKYLLLGLAYGRLGQLEQADDMFMRVEQLSFKTRPNTIRAKALANLGISQAKRRNYSRTLTFYDRALKADPEYLGAYYNLAAAQSRLNRFEESIKSLCEYSKRSDANVLQEVEDDPDHDFDQLIHHLGTSWEKNLTVRIGADVCKPYFAG